MKLTTKTKNRLDYTQANLILHKIGNQLPYFSLTGRVVEKGIEVLSGAIHKEILEAFPQLEDAAALHLSDINGKPTHSFENGKYWAGFTKYEQGNSKHLASLWRISENRARGLMHDALMAQLWQDGDGDTLPETLLKDFHDRQLRRWKQEADNIINKYNLEIILSEGVK
jgi:hypothetical protein